MKSSTLMVVLVLQAVLVMGTFAALAEENAAVGKGTGTGSGVKKCCTNCNYFSGVFTCKDIVSKCAPDCKKCVQVQTYPVKQFRCDDVGIDTGSGSCGPPCKH